MSYTAVAYSIFFFSLHLMRRQLSNKRILQPFIQMIRQNIQLEIDKVLSKASAEVIFHIHRLTKVEWGLRVVMM